MNYEIVFINKEPYKKIGLVLFSVCKYCYFSHKNCPHKENNLLCALPRSSGYSYYFLKVNPIELLLSESNK
jgi:hypothetical protein